jgi:hypothetical protein
MKSVDAHVRNGVQFLVWLALKQSGASLTINNAKELLEENDPAALRLGFRVDVADDGVYTLSPEGSLGDGERR